MSTKPIPYEVGYQITEHRSIVVWARSQAEAINKAQAVGQATELFEITTGVPESWTAHLVEQ
jgi:hypothetical protein